MEVNSSSTPSKPPSLFLQLLALQGKIDELIDDPDRPEWMIKVIHRLQRSFAPSLAPALLETHPSAFNGSVNAALFSFCKILLEMIENLLVKNKFENEFAREECVRVYEYHSKQLIEINDSIAKAKLLPLDEASAYFAAFGEDLAKGTALQSLERMGDNQTVKFCFFLILQSPQIHAGRFASVSKLGEAFFEAQRAGGNLLYEENPQAKAAALSQLRRICSADGVRLRKRGRPQNPTDAKKTAESAEKRPKKSSQKKPLSSGK